jgi:hypothetical protein
MIAYPTSDILGRGIDLQHFVDILMIKRFFYNTLDMGKIGDHTILVECCGFAIDSHYKIMTVQSFAFALITQVEIMSR